MRGAIRNPPPFLSLLQRLHFRILGVAAEVGLDPPPARLLG
jgi:hypothetical protein